MREFDSITIIIPTYNRPALLRRLLDYYDSFKERFNIMVPDSSSDENKNRNGEIVSSVSNADITYLDKYPSETHPVNKFADAVEQVKTEFCVFCADDDFVAPGGIEKSVSFLKENDDFAVAQGRYFAFHLKDGKNKRLYWKYGYSHKSILFSEADKRLEDHLSDYSQPTFYGVHRTELMKMVYRETLKSEADPYLFGELLLSMLPIIYGKMKCLDTFYAARSVDTTVAGGYWPNLRNALDAGTYDSEYAKFRDCLVRHLSEQTKLERSDLGKLVDKAMSAYTQKYYTYARKIDAVAARAGGMLSRLNLPDALDKGIRKSYSRLIKLSRAEKWSGDMSIASQYPEERDRIAGYVLSSRNG